MSYYEQKQTDLSIQETGSKTKNTNCLLFAFAQMYYY